jgi:cell division protein FtsB
MPSAVLDSPDAPPARRKSRASTSAVAPASGRRRRFQMVLVFVTLVLVINSLVGERGLMETLRARRQHAELVGSIDRLRSENARLRDQARRLRSDPATIEALARQELGLIKPGEMLFIIKDTKPAQTLGQ